MRIALAQLNLTVGDISGNAEKIAKAGREAESLGADLVLFPELALIGYPPKDLLLDASLLEMCEKALKSLATHAKKAAWVVGWPERNRKTGKPVFNSASVLHKGKILATHRKMLLPFYDVFDEGRYFEPGSAPTIFSWKGVKLGLTICEDIWNDKNYWEERKYRTDPIGLVMKKKPDAVLNLSASPYWANRISIRRRMISALAKNSRVPVFYANIVGGNDELIFDGGSLIFDAKGRMAAQAPLFEEGSICADLEKSGLNIPESCPAKGAPLAETEIYEALTLGVRDYIRKCGFKTVILGLSGGVDSSLVACLAADALGAKNVWGVSLPSRYSSEHSKEDAQALAENLGINFKTVSIEPAFEAYLKSFEDAFPGGAKDLTQQNIQARIRGAMLMAFTNNYGCMLLSTGNKSELAMGYCTLYGDMMGGLAPISDLPKGWVYKLCRWRNKNKKADIPERVLTKAPSAELKPNQTDQDTLPPYETLDLILDAYIVEGRSEKEISKKFDPELVRRIIRTVNANEFKRWQAAPGLKVTPKAFGFGRRMPIARAL